MGCCKKSDKDKELDKLSSPEEVAETGEGEEENARGTWDSPAEFILSCLGYAVGLGNVWRFPYLCYENGGGAFLIPYAIMLTFVGIPCFLIELSMGQYAAAGPLTVWTVSPLFRGIGVGMLVISFIGCIYYNMIIAWSFYYMFASFQKVLPWSHCDNEFNTDYCYSKTESEDCESDEGMFFNQTCYNQTLLNSTEPTYTCSLLNCTTAYPEPINCTLKEYLDEVADCNRTGASEEYFNLGMLRISGDMNDNGEMIWQLVLVLLLSWIVCYLCVIKGIKSSGKVVYFTATFPYLILVILLVRGATLEGALEGIKFYIIPKWEKLATPKVWADAAGQIFFSLSVGMGGLLTFASYNKFHNNVYRDTLIVAVGNCLTSFFAGFAIFSILGHMAHVLGKDVEDVAASGSGLAFIAYPEVVTYLPVSQLWSVLFFFMLLTLGLDSQFAGIENLMTAFVDTYPRFRPKKYLISAFLCLLLFLLGLTMCTQSGVYWLELMGYYSSGWSLVLIGLAESIVIGWVYFAKNLLEDIEVMVGFKLYIHWWICFTFITPLLLIAILIFNIIDFTPLTYGDYELPQWAQGIGWLMAVSSVAVIPMVSVYVIYKSYEDEEMEGLSFGKRLLQLTRPSAEWKALRNRAYKYKKGGEVDNDTNTNPPPYSVAMNGKESAADTNGFHNPGFTSNPDENNFTDITHL